MSKLTYARLVDELFPRLTGGIRWGLERTERLLARVGDPHLRYPTIHVGGTNGKGSVSATSAAMLRAHGLRVGLYTSPHLCTFRERIQIDGTAITEEALLAAASRLWPAILAEEASFFEATTAIGFLALADAAVDIAVIEVGLGGRLDSTNVISPLVTVLTNVSLDHVQLLGDTLEAVAREKAGIIKAGVPCVTGEASGVAADVFRVVAAERRAPLHVVAREDVVVEATGIDGTSFRTGQPETSEEMLHIGTTQPPRRLFHTPLAGEHQAWNSALAVRALDLLPAQLRPSESAMREGMSRVMWHGRLQREAVGGQTWIFDVAHNVAGVQALTAALDALSVARPRVALVGVLGDKDWAGMLAPLRERVDLLILTAPPTAPADRKWDLTRVASSMPVEGVRVIEDFGEALRAAYAANASDAADVAPATGGEDVGALAANRVNGTGLGGTVIVTGSFHTVGDALAMLGRCPFGSDVALPRIDFGG